MVHELAALSLLNIHLEGKLLHTIYENMHHTFNSHKAPVSHEALKRSKMWSNIAFKVISLIQIHACTCVSGWLC